MKRKDIVNKLLQEGFTEKTLSKLNDVQLKILSDRVLSEQTVLRPVTNTTHPITNVSHTDIATQNALKREKRPFSTYENEEKGTKEKDEKDAIIQKLEFKIEHEKDEKKAQFFIDLLNRIKGFDPKDDDEKEKEPELDGVSLNEWVDNVVGKNVYPFTSKNEIMEMIRSKINEQEVAEPPVKTEKLPDWLSYDAIMAAGQPSPAEPTTVPTTKPGKPGQKPKKDNPYQPGPGINPRPKAEKK